MKQIAVAVTEPEYNKAVKIFASAEEKGLVCTPVPYQEQELAEAVKKLNAEHAVIGVEKYRKELYEAVPKGGVIARFGVGFDGLDLDYASEKGILCTNTPGVLTQSVAEHTIALILCAARNIACRKGENGIELAGRTLAVLGCGSIGCRTASIAGRGFGMHVIGLKIRHGSREIYEKLKHENGFADIADSYEQAVREADFVSIHMRSTGSTRRFIDSKKLQHIKKDAWLINTARGDIVDEEALFDALKQGGVGGAALDVFTHEPYEPVSAERDLRTLGNVIMTPHTASSTEEACTRMAERALQNILYAEDGQFTHMDLLNPEVLT